MTTIRKSTYLKYERSNIWNAITSLQHFAWRSDLSRIHILNSGKQFIEYTKKGYPTTFTISLFEPEERYELEIENTRIQGSWTGLILEGKQGTYVRFVEKVKTRNILLKPFTRRYLKKQQKRYLQDLCDYLDKIEE